MRRGINRRSSQQQRSFKVELDASGTPAAGMFTAASPASPLPSRAMIDEVTGDHEGAYVGGNKREFNTR